jgi:hypothetical protein
MTQRPARPQWTGVDTYADPLGRFTFRFPSDWHRFELDHNLEGVLFAPAQFEPQTFISAWVRKLDTNVVLEDQPLLREGVAEGLAQLGELEIESEDDSAYGNLLKFERIYTFHDGSATRKRKVWIMYVDKWQIVLTYQGESPEEYEYWLPMGNYAFFHFNIPQELWFATDRDLNQPSPLAEPERVKRGRQSQA